MRFIATLIFALALPLLAFSMGSSVTYQGKLEDSEGPYTGNVNLAFRLYDDEQGGNPVGSELEFLGHPVVDGLFQVELDFGPGAFDGSGRWLEIRVDGAPLDERQPIRSAPVAQYALDAPDTLASLSCSTGEVAKWDGSSWQCAADDFEPSVWSIVGGTAVFEGDTATEGSHEVGESLEVGTELSFDDGTPQRTAGPIAKGSIDADGSIENAVNVSSATWESNDQRYRIRIAGETYFFNEYVTSIVPVEVEPLTFRITSNAGDMIVEFRNADGELTQSRFQFVTHKLPTG
jgi:hypothetical protein